jgi:hypothetical protein
MISRRQSFRYFAAAASAAAVFALLTALLSVAVDPYWLWNTPTVAGMTEMKPRATQHMFRAKTALLSRQPPTTLLLGNSRIEVSLDPQSAVWPDAMKPVFNAAIAGTPPTSAYMILRDEMQVHVPKTIIVGVDFPDFLGRLAQDQAIPIGDVPAVNPARAAWQMWQDRLETSFTVDALLDSIMTLADQRPEVSRTMRRDGFNPLNDYRVIARREGYHALFASKNSDYEAQYGRLPPYDFSKPYQNAQIRYFAGIVRLALAHDTHLIVVIHPYHRQYLDLLTKIGMWDTFESWKRSIVSVAARESEDNPGLVQIWDFSGYNAFTTEPVPRAGDTRTSMQWYWEAGHYKRELGDHVIARVTGQSSDFGRRLTADNIDSVLGEIREERNRSRLPLVPASITQ